MREMPRAAGFIPWFRIMAAFVFGSWVSVRTQVSCLHRGLCLQTGIVARLDLRYTPKDMVKPEAVANLVDHGVGVAEGAVEGRVEHDTA